MVDALKPEQLCVRCDATRFSFYTTDDLDDVKGLVGQERALEAMQFGTGIKREGYNLFVLGPSGIGKHTLVRQHLEDQAAAGATPPDLCYVNNFDHPHRPQALRLPAGRGRVLRQHMRQLLEDLHTAVPAAFETEEYHSRLHSLEEIYKERREAALKALAEEADAKNITLLRTPTGFALAPVRGGEVITPEEYEKLPEKERKQIEAAIEKLQEKLSQVIHQTPQLQREARRKVKQLDQEFALLAVQQLIDELKKNFADIDEVTAFLDRVRDDIIEHHEIFRGQEENPLGMLVKGEDDKASTHRYEVNVIVDHGESKGAPIVYEQSPMYQNLIGRIEHQAQMGALLTDFSLIKAGALHEANGGYLILDIHEVLMQPFAWEGLKRALYSREIRIQSLGQLYSLISTVSLEPEPIPLDVKVILVGDRIFYYLLLAYDRDFGELFKVAADFEEEIERTGENDMLYARLVATLVRKEELLPFDRGAVARIIEYSARLIEDAERLSTHMHSVADLLTQADYWAHQAGRKVVQHDDVQRAIDAEIRRHDRIRSRIYEEIQRGVLLIDTEGAKVAQINGLSVMDLGNFSFGEPTRITANIRLGEGEVVDIEREVELGGAIHSKGVLILTSFLGARYAATRPLSLSASLVFEQTYGGVDGDSASVAELCALLSALSKLPIKQSFAVTGSVNQHGRVQAIGGVNEKIEGFFDVCKARGLSGEQGVLIPESNVKHLMLRQEVVEATREGTFHIYPIATVDEAVAMLTGVDAGVADEQGVYPEGSVNRLVDDRLHEMAHLREEFGKHEKDDRDEKEEKEKDESKPSKPEGDKADEDEAEGDKPENDKPGEDKHD